MAEDYKTRVIDSALQQYRGRSATSDDVDHWSNQIDKVGYDQALGKIASADEAKLHSKKMSTAAGQMDHLTSQDSPLMQRAATKGKQYANSRGLLNSSFGAQAAQGAMIDAAMPMAQQDAGALQDLNKLQASSTANAWGVMANNATDIVSKTMEGIANINANPDISQADKTKMISQMTKMRDTDIKFQQDLYQSLSGFLKNTGLFPNL